MPLNPRLLSASLLALVMAGCASVRVQYPGPPRPLDQIAVIQGDGEGFVVVKVDDGPLSHFSHAPFHVLPGTHKVFVGPNGLYPEGLEKGGMLYAAFVIEAKAGRTYSFAFTKGVKGKSLDLKNLQICAYDDDPAGRKELSCVNELKIVGFNDPVN